MKGYMSLDCGSIRRLQLLDLKNEGLADFFKCANP